MPLESKLVDCPVFGKPSHSGFRRNHALGGDMDQSIQEGCRDRWLTTPVLIVDRSSMTILIETPFSVVNLDEY